MKKRFLGAVVSFALVAFAGVFFARPVQAAATTQSIAFPMYEYPTIGTLWDDIYAAGSQVPWIIANPASGPGTSVDPIYTTYLNNKPSSQRAVGYVNMGYGSVPIAQVLSDVDDWYTMYPQVSGIFFDLLQNGGAAADVCYAATVHNYVKSKHPNDMVVMNPGANVELAYEPYGDIFANAENTYANYTSWVPYTDGFENNAAYANRFWHIVHTASAGQLANALSLTRTNNAGWVLITDEDMPNPYMAVPSYWATFLTGVSSLPQTAIPNRGLSGLPAGCLDLSLGMSRTTSTQTKQVVNTITNTVTNIDTTRVSPGTTKVTYALPSGTSFASLGGSGWTCSTGSGECTHAGDIAANTALPTVVAEVAVSCNYTSGTVAITLANFAGNTAATSSSLNKPSDCVDAASTGAAGGAAAASKAKKTAAVAESPAAETSEDTVVEEQTTTTTTPRNSYTPQTTDTEDTPYTPAATFDIVPFAIGGGLLIAAVIGGAWWFLSRRSAY